ncbi:MAG: hypothetical protein WBG62_20810, partial [Cyclobacteriaceae bacterium]
DANKVKLLTGRIVIDSIYDNELSNNNDKLIITYTTKTIDKTPFAAIVPKPRKTVNKKRAYFKKQDGDWVRSGPFMFNRE